MIYFPSIFPEEEEEYDDDVDNDHEGEEEEEANPTIKTPFQPFARLIKICRKQLRLCNLIGQDGRISQS